MRSIFKGIKKIVTLRFLNKAQQAFVVTLYRIFSICHLFQMGRISNEFPYFQMQADIRYYLAGMLNGLEARLLVVGKINNGETYNNKRYQFNKGAYQIVPGWWDTSQG